MSDNGRKCPMSGANTATGARSNQDWWPNQMNLKILHQNSPQSDPMGEDFNYAEEFKTLDLDALIVSPQLVRELMPPHYGHSANAERFPGRTGALFDPVAAAVLAADVTISALLHPARAERLSQQDGARRHFGLVDVLKRLVEKTDYAKAESDQSSAPVRRAVQRLLVDRLMELAVSQRVSQDVRSAASGTLFDHLRGRYPETTDIDQWHARSIDEAIQRFRARAHQAAKTPTQLTSPPGSPIGR